MKKVKDKNTNEYEIKVRKTYVTEFDVYVAWERTYHRFGKSVKQVISRLRYDFNYRDHDNDYGSESVVYEFEIKEIPTIKPGFEQLKLF